MTTNYSVSSVNQYTAVGTSTPLYDTKLNLRQFNGASYFYDADSRLTSIGTQPGGHSASFLYDALGRCVKRTVDGTATVITYDGWTPIMEWDTGGSAVASNFYGIGDDEILSRALPNGTQYLYRSDPMGNIMFLMQNLNSVATGVEKYTYDAFGKPTVMDWSGTAQTQTDADGTRPYSPLGNRFMFQGREFHSTFGLYDFRNRVYHPQLGRFMQSDPIGFGGGDVNLFRYCAHNPVGRSDSAGLDSFTVGGQPATEGDSSSSNLQFSGGSDGIPTLTGGVGVCSGADCGGAGSNGGGSGSGPGTPGGSSGTGKDGSGPGSSNTQPGTGGGIGVAGMLAWNEMNSAPWGHSRAYMPEGHGESGVRGGKNAATVGDFYDHHHLKQLLHGAYKANKSALDALPGIADGFDYFAAGAVGVAVAPAVVPLAIDGFLAGGRGLASGVRAAGFAYYRYGVPAAITMSAYSQANPGRADFIKQVLNVPDGNFGSPYWQGAVGYEIHMLVKSRLNIELGFPDP